MENEEFQPPCFEAYLNGSSLLELHITSAGIVIIDGLVKSPSHSKRWLRKNFDIQGVVVRQVFGYTYGMPKVWRNAATPEIGLFTTPSSFIYETTETFT